MPDILDEAKALLVRRWGEMGGYWGISRSMAEIHALLLVWGRPLCTDDVMASLHVSRGNASMNLRGLVDWGLVRRVHQLGDRKEYFQADTNVWHMFETIMRERRRREFEPIIATIDRCRDLVASIEPAGAQAAEVAEFRGRLDELRNFLATMGALFELVLRFGSAGVAQFSTLLGTMGGAPGGAERSGATSSARQDAGSAPGGATRPGVAPAPPPQTPGNPPAGARVSSRSAAAPRPAGRPAARLRKNPKS
jgi:HTH-type transcriptional regulator, glycine betaine synthesis regulator